MMTSLLHRITSLHRIASLYRIAKPGLFCLLFCPVFCLSLVSFVTHAEQSTDYEALFKASADNAALSKLVTRLGGGESARGEFTQSRYLKVLKKPLVSRGEFLFQDKLGIAWLQTAPFPSGLVLTQNTLVQIDADGNRQVSHADDNPQAGAMAQMMPKLMSALLSGDIAPLEAQFTLHLQQQAECWQLGLEPIDPLIKQAMPRIVLQGNEQLESLSLLDNRGDLSVIEFNALAQRPLTADEQAYFKLDADPRPATEAR
ncbi:outer membrane lipoprotein carrier protein LolA [Shewanella rhizosphaerae]|uniref:outer membrane lipoprotein carrier protein LolA n=1 Tax=Shewanella rhizosphaerae TaxID=2864207 RepID=UPI001C66022F|nr:outer membrane lipoprotein carrier protein LolA [Shewanella rhizosphaerae]QYK12629.1 outer membrane lipoprotein carrier protein LolA [Shewanella rhizosphaerae]